MSDEQMCCKSQDPKPKSQGTPNGAKSENAKNAARFLHFRIWQFDFAWDLELLAASVKVPNAALIQPRRRLTDESDDVLKNIQAPTSNLQ
jgi:hypothetical protein